MMSDTQAMFALMDDEDIVKFIRENKNNAELSYEVWCALAVLGTKLRKQYGFAALWKVRNNA